MSATRVRPSIGAEEAVTILNIVSQPSTPWMVLPENAARLFAANGEFVLAAATRSGKKVTIFRLPNPADPQGPQWAWSEDNGDTFAITGESFTEFLGKIGEALSSLH